MTPVMWYDDSSPFRSKDMDLRRKLEPSPSSLPDRPRKTLPPSPRVLLAGQMRQEGFSVKTIASLLGVSRQRVSQMVKRARR